MKTQPTHSASGYTLSGLLPAVLFLFAGACERPELGQAEVPEPYEPYIEEWVTQHIESLKAPTGWMRLAGMYILDEGENTFGSGNRVHVPLADEALPAEAGTITLTDGVVTLNPRNDVHLLADGEPVRGATTIFADGEESIITHNHLEWFVIKRQDIYAIRVFNKENEKVDRFEGFPRYDTDSKWRLKAYFEPHPENTTIPIANVIGQVIETPSPGSLTFQFGGERYTIDAIQSSEQLFLIIGDETNRTETYQAGRYMYVDYPDDDGYTVIDFNKIYNPPCSYNLFTTCELPPVQNRLRLAIEAGEKRPVGWTGQEIEL
ncbi:MAG: DUF1684 domain-containing protein [Balneolaceae bacterium]